MCVDCDPVDQDRRHAHFLALAAREDTEAVQAHIMEDIATRMPNADRQRLKATVADVMTWVHGQISTYSHMVDARTGAKLPWWEGRRQSIAAFHQAYIDIGHASDAAKAAREVHGFQRATSERFTQTPLREPGEEG